MRRKATPKPGWNDDPPEFGSTHQPGLSANDVQKQIDEATREAGEKVGMRGSLGNVSAGGARLMQGAGFQASNDGVRKSQIEPDGDVFIGSNIDTPEGLSLAVFVNAQTWNTEDMEEGDILIGDIVKYAEKFQDFLDGTGGQEGPKYRYFKYTGSPIWYRVMRGNQVAERYDMTFGAKWESAGIVNTNPHLLSELIERPGYVEVPEDAVPVSIREDSK